MLQVDSQEQEAYFTFKPLPPWKHVYKLLFNVRGIGTSWDVSRIRKGSDYQRVPETIEAEQNEYLLQSELSEMKEITTIRSRWMPIVRRLGLMIAYIVPLVIYKTLRDRRPFFLHASDVEPEKEVFIRRLLRIYPGGSHVTLRELCIRLWSVVENNVPDYLEINIMQHSTATFFMILGLDEGWEWPPLFGSIVEVYSVRRFWGKFWHLLIYKSFSAHSWTLMCFCGMSQKTALSRFIRNFLVFAGSAWMHGTVDWRMSPPCGYSRSLIYWFLQPMAFALEGVVSHYWQQYVMRRYDPPRRELVVFERVVGYLWTFSWFYWCVPKRLYPLLTCDSIL